MSLSWDITGNTGTDPNHHFLGTTDGKPLVIQKNGNVGIGTTTPADKLQVQTDANSYGITQTNGAVTVGTYVVGSSKGAGRPFIMASGGFGTRSNHPLSFFVNNSPSMTIVTGGNVGIGTTRPSGRLHISGVDSYNDGLYLTGSSNVGSGLTIENTDRGGKKFVLFSSGSGNDPKMGAGAFNIYDAAAGAYRLTISSSGNVGIGTTTPADKLQVQTATGTYGITQTDGVITVGTYVGGSAGGGWFGTQSNHPLSFFVNDGGPAMTIATSGNVGIGTTSPSAALEVNGSVTVTGDVVLTGADCAEEFDISEAAEIEPGTVMVLEQEGGLRQSQRAYDKRVAGVISGAGTYKPGLILDRQQARDHRLPVALVGKVYCKVDARYAPIAVGDLLTTSPTPGHAMKAVDPFQAFGSVIGKALRPLEAGQGMIPILIALQ